MSLLLRDTNRITVTDGFSHFLYVLFWLLATALCLSSAGNSVWPCERLTGHVLTMRMLRKWNILYPVLFHLLLQGGKIPTDSQPRLSAQQKDQTESLFEDLESFPVPESPFRLSSVTSVLWALGAGKRIRAKRCGLVGQLCLQTGESRQITVNLSLSFLLCKAG